MSSDADSPEPTRTEAEQAKDGPATLNGASGVGLMTMVKDRLARINCKGHFRAEREEDHLETLLDCFRSRSPCDFEGPVLDPDGRTQRMRVKVLIRYISATEPCSPVTLYGTGPADVIE